MDRVECALCVFVLGLVLGKGQAGDLFSAYPKPANLSDHYTLSETGDDPWFWTCKKGVPLLHGRRNEYKLAFEVDEEDHFRRLKDQVNRKEIELKLYRGSSDPFVKFENDRFIVGDFPVMQTLWTYGVNVTFGEPEPLANDLPPGVMEVNF
ncbi:unnamed protein product [Bemisia tabaci]|uniref:Uncharacterized protein n=1 Tax=Bemisia tabaci TaxID=7038 RepID=A0A9P0A8W5_BEMTA|nr:unnamed protein product [Bemisia tabaci]